MLPSLRVPFRPTFGRPGVSRRLPIPAVHSSSFTKGGVVEVGGTMDRQRGEAALQLVAKAAGKRLGRGAL